MSLLTNLISYFKLDGNSNDAVGSNNGTDTAITYNSANGKINQGAGFNGTTSKIAGSAVTIPANATISCWFETSQIQSFYPRMFCFENPSASSSSFSIMLTSGGYPGIYLRDNSGNVIYKFSSSTFNDGNWHYAVATKTNTSGNNYTIELFIDGVSQGTASGSCSGTFTGAVMGIGTPDGANFYQGDVDECGYWSRVLNITEIGYLYNNGNGLQYPFNYSLTYNAGNGGSISGISPQSVAPGGNGTSVTAIPNNNYIFSSWSDGILTATRQDLNVSGNINVIANFINKFSNQTKHISTFSNQTKHISTFSNQTKH